MKPYMFIRALGQIQWLSHSAYRLWMGWMPSYLGLIPNLAEYRLNNANEKYQPAIK